MTIDVLMLIIKLLFIPVLSPLCIGIIRKTKAFLQNRQGASIFQPYRDLSKLFQKDEVISPDASWIFLLTPLLVFTISIVLPLGIPFLSNQYTVLSLSDLFVIIYMFTLSSFFLSLAGMDTGSSFGGFGSSREMTVLALTEGGLFFAFVPLALLAHTTNLTSMATFTASLDWLQFGPLLIAGIGFFIALLAENARIPFDNPATHLELTMIHEAMILEYSGKRLALIEWAAANKLLLFIILGVLFFTPWNITVDFTNPTTIAWSVGVLLLKILLVLISIGILESSIAKLRFFRLPDLLLTSFVLGVIATFIVLI